MAANGYNTALSVFASSYSNGAFIADKVCPVSIVDAPAGTYTKLAYGNMTTPYDTEMAISGRARELDWAYAPGTYLCVTYGDKVVVPQFMIDSAARSGFPLKPLEFGTELVMYMHMFNREIRVATMMQTQANYPTGNYTTVSNYWSDTTLGAPVDNFDTAIAALPPSSSDTKLVAIMAKEAAQYVRKHPDFIGAGSARPVASMSEIADILGVDEVYVTDAVKNTANPGQATATLVRVWDKTKVIVARVPKSEILNGTNVESFCATFRMPINGSGANIGVRTYRDEGIGVGGSEIVQAEHADADVVVQSNQAYLIQGVLA